MAPRGEMMEKERHEPAISRNSDSDEELQHYDSIELDSCDFQPFLTTQSGIALNYHTSDHPEHKILMQESFVESNHDESCCSQAMHSAASCLVRIRPHQCPGVMQEERFPKRRVAFMGAIAFVGFLALWHVMNATRLLNFRAFTSSPKLAMHNSQSTRITSGIPKRLQNFYRNVNDVPIEASDVPVYIAMPGGAATNVTNVFSKCFGLQLQSSHQQESLEFINASVLVTNNIWETASRWNATVHRGRLVAVFDNPVERVLHDYNRHASSHQEKDSLTLQQYLSTVPDNSMVRTLVNVTKGPLTDEHLEMAKHLVQTKILVGLPEKPTLSLSRFQSYFNWRDESPKDCTRSLLAARQATTNVEKDSPDYVDARNANRLDAQLYTYVRQIFQEQSMVSSR